MQTFASLGLSECILRGVDAAGYTTPTPIQSAAISPALEGRDLIGCAQTGTGKTAAFVLPMLDRLAAFPTGGGYRPVRALVVTPTRELALQVEESVRTYGAHAGLRSMTIFGGVPMGPQLQRTRRGADVVVATPGRLLDHLDRGSLDLSSVEVLVLDEADRMFDMGFIRDVRRIVAATPRKRQTLLFSATMPPPIQELASSILHDPHIVKIGRQTDPVELVAQTMCAVPQERKMDLLIHLLETEPVGSVLVFSRTKHRADRIARKLGQNGFSATVIHGNRSQGQRQRALEGFKSGQFNILVATDIAARGIDVDGITHVINFDTPNQAEDYIHRIGRTGRADATGDAITFVSQDEQPYLKEIEKHTGKRLQRRSVEGFIDDAPAQHRASNGQAESGRPSGSKRSSGRKNRRGAPRSA